MTYKELQDAVAEKVKDTSTAIAAMIPDIINEAYQQITEDVTLPGLKAVGLVNTVVAQEWVNIKSTITDFSGKLLYVGTKADGPITIVDGGVEQLYQTYYDLDADGDLEAVAQEGDVLYYYKTPATATSLVIIYYRTPTTMAADGDTPSYLPDLLHRDLIVNKSSAIIFDHIEEGMEGDKVNTRSCLAQYEIAKAKLSAWAHRRRPNVGRSFWSV